MKKSENQHLNSICALNEEKLNILKEMLDISLKIKDAACSAPKAEGEFRVELDSQSELETDKAIEHITALVDFREEFLEKIKNIDLSVNHYASRIRAQEKDALGDLEEFEKTFSADAKIVLEAIKAADEQSSQRIAELMSAIKLKIDAVKENRALMDRFVGGSGAPSSSGTLLSEKK